VSILPDDTPQGNPGTPPTGDFWGDAAPPPAWRRATVLSAGFNWDTLRDDLASVRGFRSGNLAIAPSRQFRAQWVLCHYRSGQAVHGSATLRDCKRLAAAVRARFGDLAVLDRKAEAADLSPADQARLAAIGAFITAWRPLARPVTITPYVPFDDHAS
jgi:hypothetical protein